MLKDILAFANSWRTTTAYILVGVEEVMGGRSNVVGYRRHLDDAIGSPIRPNVLEDATPR